MSLITSYPAWFVIFCIVGGLIYAGALYTKDRLNKHFHKALILLLAFLRFAAVSIIAFFLLGPLLKSIDRQEQKPVIVIAQDNSESLILGDDSLFMQGRYQQDLQNLKTALSEQYDVQSYIFGEEVSQQESASFDAKFTDFSQLFDQLYNRFSNRNLGAVILASDGIYNRGRNPLYAFDKLNTPVFTVALGDTTPQRDVLINQVVSNRLAYLGNSFPMEVVVQGRKLKGEKATMKVVHIGKTVATANVSFSGDDDIVTIPLVLEAKNTGLQKYRIQLTELDNELTLANNYKDVFVDVLDSRQKILILSQKPHPDIAALRAAITSNENYSCEVELAKSFSGNIKDYSLVIFHQLPGGNNAESKWVQQAIDAKIPQFYILGMESDYGKFGALNLGFNLDKDSRAISESEAQFSTGFSLFKLEEPTKKLFRQLPPLSSPFGVFSTSPGASPMLMEEIGNISTGKALLAFNTVNDFKVGVLRGEGIWKWRLNTYAITGSHKAFNEWIGRTVQYLASKEDKRLFRTEGKRDFLENETITIQAELYNASYEPILEADIALTLRNDAGNEFDYAFSAQGEGYQAKIGKMPVGNYTYTAQTKSDGQTLKSNGEFSVSPIQLEAANTQANHQLLFQLADNTGGEMLYANELSGLSTKLANRPDIVTLSYEKKELSDLIDQWWIMVLILLLLSAEWLLRKRAGAY